MRLIVVSHHIIKYRAFVEWYDTGEFPVLYKAAREEVPV